MLAPWRIPFLFKFHYFIQIVLNDDTISDSLCTCPRGQGICHHIAAVCIFIHNNFSSTDLPCTPSTWNTRKQNNDMKLKALMIFIHQNLIQQLIVFQMIVWTVLSKV